MRMMLKVEVPVQAGNESIRNGSLPETIGSLFARIQPEGAYFTTHDGQRCAYVFFDLADPSDIPSVAEPLFMNLDAKVDLQPCMNLDELQAGLGKLAG